MNIGIFTDTFFPQISGVDTSVRILAKGLRRLGHKPLIFTTTDPGARENLPDVFRLPSVPFVFFPSRRFAYFYPPKLLAKMKSFKLDLIHTQTEFTIGWFGKLTAEILRVPLLHTYHTMYENYTHYLANGRLFSPNVARQYSKVFCNNAMAVTVPGEKTRDCLLSYGVRKPIHFIPTGIDFSHFKPERFTEHEIAAARTDLGLNPGDPALITIGRVAKEKSHDVILRAMPEIIRAIPRAKYVSVGDGPYMSELATLAHSLGISKSVIFAGPRPWTEIGKYYQTGDIFISASTTETQGITYIEAMAAQIPLIAKRDKTVESILIHNETGLFFDEVNELAGAAISLLNNPDERQRLAANAYAHIQPLSAEIFTENMVGLYSDLIREYDDNNKKSRIKPLIRLKKYYKR